MIPNSRTQLIRSHPVCDYNKEEHELDSVVYAAKKHKIKLDPIIQEAIMSSVEDCMDTAEYRVKNVMDNQQNDYSDYCEKHMLLDDALVRFWEEVDAVDS